MNQRTELAQQVTEAEESIVKANDLTQDILARRAYRQKLPAEGLNVRYRWLKLPVAMPSGRNWAIAYFVVTLVHLTQYHHRTDTDAPAFGAMRTLAQPAAASRASGTCSRQWAS